MFMSKSPPYITPVATFRKKGDISKVILSHYTNKDIRTRELGGGPSISAKSPSGANLLRTEKLERDNRRRAPSTL